MTTVAFKTGNAAFEDDREHEIAIILRQIAKEIDGGRRSGTIRDSNGNKIGTYKR